MATNNAPRYDAQKIREKSVDILTKKGVDSIEAAVVVDSMLEADICGVGTHGIRMLASYVQKLDAGQFSLEDVAVVKSSPAFTLLDAKSGIGAITAWKASRIAIEQAKTSGAHIVFARRCNTFGPAFYYADLMAREGMIGFVCCNAPAASPAFNGLEAMLGTNPLAFACPSQTEGTIVLDMATSVVAKSRFEAARVNNERLPEGWALDANGAPTTDPVEAIKGFVLPMAGFKGYGIAMAIDLVAGFLSGAGYLNKVGKFYSPTNACMNVGQLFVALNPELVYDGDFKVDMDAYIQTLRRSKSQPGKTVALPGDDRAAAREKALKEGIVLSNDAVVKLTALFEDDVPFHKDLHFPQFFEKKRGEIKQ